MLLCFHLKKRKKLVKDMKIGRKNKRPIVHSGHGPLQSRNIDRLMI